MNCDEAFDCLTDPLCRRGDELKWHLNLCARCRQMQDVLSPAIDLLAAPSEPRESSSPPRWGDESGLDLEAAAARPATISADSIQYAERIAATLARQSPDRRPTARRLGSWARLAGVFVLGAALTLVATTWTNRGTRDGKTTSGISSKSDCLWTHRGQDSKATPSRTSKQVVLSCVECHLSRPID